MATPVNQVPQKIESFKTETTALAQAVSELQDALRQMRWKRIDCGKVIFDFQNSQKPSYRTIAVETLADAAGISRRTAFSYLKLYRDSQVIGTDLLLRAEEVGIDIDSPSQVRKLTETKTNLPTLEGEEIIAKTLQKLAAMKAKRAVARKHADPLPDADASSPKDTGRDPTVGSQVIEISSELTSSVPKAQPDASSANVALRKPPVSAKSSDRERLVSLAYQSVQSVFCVLDGRERNLAINQLCEQLQSGLVATSEAN